MIKIISKRRAKKVFERSINPYRCLPDDKRIENTEQYMHIFGIRQFKAARDENESRFTYCFYNPLSVMPPKWSSFVILPWIIHFVISVHFTVSAMVWQLIYFTLGSYYLKTRMVIIRKDSSKLYKILLDNKSEKFGIYKTFKIKQLVKAILVCHSDVIKANKAMSIKLAILTGTVMVSVIFAINCLLLGNMETFILVTWLYFVFTASGLFYSIFIAASMVSEEAGKLTKDLYKLSLRPMPAFLQYRLMRVIENVSGGKNKKKKMGFYCWIFFPYTRKQFAMVGNFQFPNLFT